MLTQANVRCAFSFAASHILYCKGDLIITTQLQLKEPSPLQEMQAMLKPLLSRLEWLI